MVKLTRIYTRGGDKGETSLGAGQRVSKADSRIQAIGDVDEANATIGLAQLYAKNEEVALLSTLQNDLFDIGADLCVPLSDNKKKRLRLKACQVTFLEEKIDFYNQELKELESFILPGGSLFSSFLHSSRTVVRRAERSICALAEIHLINLETIQYMNRLSDLLFVLARYGNEKGQKDVLWVPGESQLK